MRCAANAPDVAAGGSLQIRQDLPYQRRAHAVQRVLVLLFVLAFLAAVAGVFGTGPVAHATVTAPGGTFSVEYDRFVRGAQSSSLQISPQTQSGGGGEIDISSAYLQAIQLSDVTPQPDSETERNDQLVLTFQNRLPAQVQVGISPKTIGLHEATIWVRGKPVSFHQVVYP